MEELVVAISHGGMQRSLEMMKEMARSGGKLERDGFEHVLPYVALAVVGLGVAVLLVIRLVAWLS